MACWWNWSRLAKVNRERQRLFGRTRAALPHIRSLGRQRLLDEDGDGTRAAQSQRLQPLLCLCSALPLAPLLAPLLLCGSAAVLAVRLRSRLDCASRAELRADSSLSCADWNRPEKQREAAQSGEERNATQVGAERVNSVASLPDDDSEQAGGVPRPAGPRGSRDARTERRAPRARPALPARRRAQTHPKAR